MVVSAQNLSRRFGRRWAYARINLELLEGDSLLLIGANGSGKTTLLRSIATLLPHSVGRLEVFGQDALNQRDFIRSKLGYLAHHTGLYEDLSAVENLLVFAKLIGLPFSTKDAHEALAAVGLEQRNDPVRAYSAGMRKRASLATLLLKRPSLVLLDEPFSALDPSGIDQVSQFISELQATTIIVSHQVERAATLCNRCLLLESGLERWSGPATKAWDAWRVSQQAGGTDG